MSDKVRYFQWLSLDRKGEIMIFDKIVIEDGIVFICFKDGSRINEEFVANINVKDVTGKLMAEIDNPKNGWNFEEQWVGREEEVWELNGDGISVCVQPFVEGRKTFKLIPPTPTAPSKSNFGVIEQKTITPNETILNDTIVGQTSPNVVSQPAANMQDPVYIMISKSKKIDQIVEMELSVSLPSVSLFNVIAESFENGDEKLLEYIIQDIDVTSIKNAIKDSLRVMYTGENKISVES